MSNRKSDAEFKLSLGDILFGIPGAVAVIVPNVDARLIVICIISGALLFCVWHLYLGHKKQKRLEAELRKVTRNRDYHIERIAEMEEQNTQLREHCDGQSRFVSDICTMLQMGIMQSAPNEANKLHMIIEFINRNIK